MDISPLCLAPPEDLPSDLRALREAVPARPSDPDAPHHPLPDPHEQDFDAFFGIVRCNRLPAAGLLATALSRTVGIMSPLADAEDRARLTVALRRAGRPSPPPRAPASHGGASAWEKWIHGHRLFFALTQATVVALKHAITRPEDPVATIEGSDSAIAFLHASAAALRLTAAFSRDAYHRAVRPAMAPPVHPAEGFSGLWSADHRVLVQELGRWGEAITAPTVPVRITCDLLRDAVRDVYQSHIGVCDRFVGHGPSLLGGTSDSLATLAKLAHARQRLLAPRPD
ncbi:hypothetical protein ACFWIA_12645 [Streptomyces sp. NPDC127068]|uniref:hypothetical protein n=1 Tax=Streptomyces sp. NPDC127068 TaxID=3347127 RepID=UPI003661E115